MKKILLLLVTIAFVACKENKEDKSQEESTVEETTNNSDFDSIDWSTLNNQFTDPEEEGNLLLGKINFEGLQRQPYNEWFELNKKEHTLDTLAINSIQSLLGEIQLKVYMGTWCEDSQREIPALEKILLAANFDFKNLNMIAMSHDKDTPPKFEEKDSIEYVPTIIIMKNGKEINRIVEYTQISLEQDLLSILKGEPYQNVYEE